ncbi:MAG: helix-turn-helix domain-containing GNAT family N-acetyltransferase [Pseudomonadota bacterium]
MTPGTDTTIDTFRHFNRFHTKLVGALDDHLLDTGFTLVQARLIYELEHDDNLSASDLSGRLELDRGYLSRLITALEKAGAIEKQADPKNAKRQVLGLTALGKKGYRDLVRATEARIGTLVSPLSQSDQKTLCKAMTTFESLLAHDGRRSKQAPMIVLRDLEIGDIGHLISRHGITYNEAFGWDGSFEVVVAEILAKFRKASDPKRERAWIADVDGEVVGSVFVVEESEKVARLRLLFVEPSMRGHGLGSRLVEECIRFARASGYEALTLWTIEVLTSARKIYEAAGFEIDSEELLPSFGQELINQSWTLKL